VVAVWFEALVEVADSAAVVAVEDPAAPESPFEPQPASSISAAHRHDSRRRGKFTSSPGRIQIERAHYIKGESTG
jgi:hypothetical protein